MKSDPTKKPITFLSPEILGNTTRFIEGIRHDVRTHEDNEEDGFEFNKCKHVNFIHPMGSVYLFEDWGYVANGYDWLRFKMVDLKVISN